MVEECSALISELLEAKRPGGEPLLDPRLRDRAQLALALLDETREESSANQRYASLGRLAGAVLHELLNPLAFLQTNLEVLSANLPALLAGDAGRDAALAEDTRSMVEDSRAGVERISSSLSALRILLRDDPVAPQRGDARRAADAAARLISMRLPHGVRVEQHYEDVRPSACGDGLIGQVLLHLLIRSLDAVGQQGTISLRVVPDTDGSIRAEVEHATSTAPEQHQLGFSLAQHLVERAGGLLERLPFGDHGARYVVHLPAAPDA